MPLCSTALSEEVKNYWFNEKFGVSVPESKQSASLKAVLHTVRSATNLSEAEQQEILYK